MRKACCNSRGRFELKQNYEINCSCANHLQKETSLIKVFLIKFYAKYILKP